MVDKTNFPPPPPLQFLQPGNQGSVNWNWYDWFYRFQSITAKFPVGGKWKWTTDIDFTGSNLTDIQTRNHNDLQNIQLSGTELQTGSTAEFYHLNFSRSQWPLTRKTVNTAETTFITANYQMTVHVKMTITGIVMNSGELFIDLNNMDGTGEFNFSSGNNSSLLVIL